MISLLILGLVGGVVTGISLCVLPVLPVILGDSVSGRQIDRAGVAVDERPGRWRPLSWRPYAVVGGLVISFTVVTLFGSLVLDAIGLPAGLLRGIGVAVLLLVGSGLVWPRLGALLERPFARTPGRRVSPDGNGLALGLGLGLLFVPCAGPVLAVIALLGAAQRFSVGAVFLAVGFTVGVGIPLLAVALAGDSLSRRVGALRRRTSALRTGAGVVMAVTALLIGFGATDGLVRLVPGYTDTLQRAVDGSSAGAGRLRALTDPSTGSPRVKEPAAPDPTAADRCTVDSATPVDCGRAPQLTGITGWLNTPGNAPLSLDQLRGKVVLVDFWTYSCINCQRTLPHVEAWYRNYRDAGFVVVGVHTPEFAFEHVPDNIMKAARELGVQYPIAIDNDYGTWNAYDNQYWPAEYLIDRSGVIRHLHFGEGGYEETEGLIRELLAGPDPTAGPPPVTALAERPLPVPAVPAGTATWAPWPGALHDARHSGAGAGAGPVSGAVRWRRELEGAVTSGPVVGPDGTVYVSSNGGVLHALDPVTGADRWIHDSGSSGGGDLSVSPLVLPDGTVLFPTPGRELVALSPAGRVLWSERLPGVPTSPASVDGHRVYVGDRSGTITALRVYGGDHRVLWTVSVGDGSYGSVVTDGTARLYTTTGSSLVALDDLGDHATIAWTRDPGDDITEVSAGVAADHTALLGTNGGREWAYHPDGSPAWNASRVITYSSPITPNGGLAYVADHSGRVQVWRTDTGHRVASFGPLPAQIWSSTVVDRDYRLYFGTQDGHVLGLGPDGSVLFDVPVGAPVDSYPALTGDGALLIGSRNRMLTAIG